MSLWSRWLTGGARVVQPISRSFPMEEPIHKLRKGAKRGVQHWNDLTKQLLGSHQVNGNDGPDKAGVQTLFGSHACKNLPSEMSPCISLPESGQDAGRFPSLGTRELYRKPEGAFGSRYDQHYRGSTVLTPNRMGHQTLNAKRPEILGHLSLFPSMSVSA